jgi:hypothetical protein
MNIGKAAPPQMLPISASIPLSQLPSDHNSLGAYSLGALCETLEIYDLLKNAVGISMDTLYLTAHLGSEDIRTKLIDYGFTIDRHQVAVYVLSKNHDTTTITAASLSDELISMRAAIPPALTQFEALTDMAPLPGIMDDRLSAHLMRLIVPAHTLSLAVIFPLTNGILTNGIISKMSFDTLILGSYARGRHVHQRPLSKFLDQEFGKISMIVERVFPDLAPAFKIWATSYVQYLMDRVTQDGVVEAVVAQVVSAIDTTKAVPVQEEVTQNDQAQAQAPAETLKDKMTRYQTDQGMPVVDGPLTAVETAEVNSNDVVHVRRINQLPIRAWRIPHPGTMRGEMVSIPYWATRCTTWTFNEDHGRWLVIYGSDVELLTNEQFEKSFALVD